MGHHLVDAVGGRKAVAGSLLLHAPVHHPADVAVALVGDDALGIVLQLGFAVPDVLLQVGQQLLPQPQLLPDLFIPLKELDGVPPEIAVVHPALNGLLDVGQGVLHAAGKDMGVLPTLFPLCQLQGLFRRRHAPLPPEGAGLQYRAAQLLPQPCQVDAVPVFPHQVYHIYGDDHGYSQFYQLGGEVEVPLDVGAVHNVDDGAGLFLHQVSPGHHLLQGVGGKGIDAGEVLDEDIPMFPELSLLLLHRDAGPVAYILAGPGEVVKHGRFAAVGISRKGDGNAHNSPHSFVASAQDC